MRDSSPFLTFVFGVLSICSIVLSIKTAFFSAQPSKQVKDTQYNASASVYNAPKATQTPSVQTHPVQEPITPPVETKTVEIPLTQPAVQATIPQAEQPVEAPVQQQTNSELSVVDGSLHFDALYYGDPVEGRTGNIEYWIVPIVSSAWFDDAKDASDLGFQPYEKFFVLTISYEIANANATDGDFFYPEASIILDNDGQRLEVERDISTFQFNNSVMPNERKEGNICFIPKTDWSNSRSLDFYLFKANSDTNYEEGNYKRHTFTLKDIGEING